MGNKITETVADGGQAPDVVEEFSKGEERLGPTTRGERIEVLDLIRGVAVLAILLVNINSLALPGSSFSTPWLWGPVTIADRWVFWLNGLFVQSKFYSLFSILFGAGLALQLQRLSAQPATSETVFFVRRLGFLALVGVLHVLLIWSGDILLWYAIAAVVALALSPLPPRHLFAVGLAGILLPVAVLLNGLTTASETADPGFPVTEADVTHSEILPFTRQLEAMIAETPKGIAAEVHLYRHGSFARVAVHRVTGFFWASITSFTYVIPIICGYMLIGMALLRVGFFQGLVRRRAVLAAIALAAGLGGVAITAF